MPLPRSAAQRNRFPDAAVRSGTAARVCFYDVLFRGSCSRKTVIVHIVHVVSSVHVDDLVPTSRLFSAEHVIGNADQHGILPHQSKAADLAHGVLHVGFAGLMRQHEDRHGPVGCAPLLND